MPESMFSQGPLNTIIYAIIIILFLTAVIWVLKKFKILPYIVKKAGGDQDKEGDRHFKFHPSRHADCALS